MTSARGTAGKSTKIRSIPTAPEGAATRVTEADRRVAEPFVFGRHNNGGEGARRRRTATDTGIDDR